ncbi:MAG: flagellar basal body P-ring formation chaperone FlgA [Desulfarculales bacterium]|jgi:flagella basal body P-ring formation protein FlgA|nr:flagellar basal body P-ring formation chaperone FlgA [Desulfarculales bacterium]
MKIIKFSLSVLFFALFLAPPLGAQEGSLVRILANVEVDQPLITLWHLADHSKPMDDDLSARLSATPIGIAPEPGQSFTLDGSELRRLIAQADLDGQVSVLLPASVRVKRAIMEISQQRLKQIYEETLRADAEQRQVDILIGEVKTGPAVILPSGTFTYEAKRLGGKWGEVVVLLDLFIDGKLQAQARLSGKVEVYGQALVAARSLPSGHVLTYDDLQLAQVSLEENQGAAVSDPGLLVGQRLRSPLSAGNVIDPRRVQRQVLVRPGDVVTMICANPSIKLSTKGKAEQNGYYNSLIKLTNINSRQQVYGRVIDAGTVIIEF